MNSRHGPSSHQDVCHRCRAGDRLEGGAQPASRSARIVPPDQRSRGRAWRQAVRSRSQAAGLDRRRRALAGRVPQRPERGGFAERASPAAPASGCRRAEGRGDAADDRWRLFDVPASLCRALSQRADQIERGGRHRILCKAGTWRAAPCHQLPASHSGRRQRVRDLSAAAARISCGRPRIASARDRAETSK